MSKRIHIELGEKAAADLEILRKQLGVNTKTEAIKASISLTKFLELQKENNQEIIIRDPKTKRESRLVTLR
ncbi:MAG: hypothetical protein WC758_02615 [Candidatus Woesearchaeota archaeon]|jgi:hypothetical protein